MNQPIIYEANESIIVDTWKGNKPYGHSILSPEQAKKRFGELISNEQWKLDNKYAPGSASYKATQGRIQTLESNLNDLTSGTGQFSAEGQSGQLKYTWDPITGNLTTQAAIDQEQGYKDAVAAGTMKEIAPGKYVPTGSAGDPSSPIHGAVPVSGQYDAMGNFVAPSAPLATGPSVYNVPTGEGGTYSGTPEGAPAGVDLAPYTGTSAGTTPQAQVPSEITSENLGGAPSITPTTPATQTPYDITKLPEIKLTPSEEEESDLTKRVKELQEQLVGRTEYQTEQEEAKGVPALITTQTDLTSQLENLKNEAEGLRLESQGIPFQIQQESEGRGRTKAGAAPLEASAQRANTLQQIQIATQALTVNSLLAASQGQLSNAQYLADRAVKQKFGPIEEEIAAKMANINLVRNSPEASVEDKNRALQTEFVLNTQKQQLDQAKQNAKSVQNIAIEAAATGLVPSNVLTQLAQMTDPIQAAALAAPYLAEAEAQGAEQWSEPYYLGGDIVQKNENTGQIRTAVNVAAGSGGNINLSTTKKTGLLGAGYSTSDISTIEKGVNENGFTTVYEAEKAAGATTQQLEALQDVYGQDVDKLTRENLSQLFGIPDDDSVSGFWNSAASIFGGGKTNKEKLDDLMDTVERYKAVGYSDAEILKLMQ